MEKEGTSGSLRDLSISYDKVGGILSKQGGEENLKKALELYSRSLEISKELVEKEGTSESWRDLSISYDNVGDILLQQGGGENLKRALELYSRGLEISKELVEKEGTNESWRDLTVSLYKLSKHPLSAPDIRRRYLERLCSVSEKLYQQEKSREYQQIIEFAQAELKKMTQEV